MKDTFLDFTEVQEENFLRYINSVADRLHEEEQKRVVTPEQLDFVYTV